MRKVNKCNKLMLMMCVAFMGLSSGTILTACNSSGSSQQSSTINSAEKRLERIAITKKPVKTSYVVGEKFDPTGMEVTATYSDKTTELVTKYDYDKKEALTRADNLVQITYEGKVAMLPIIVTIDVSEALKITSTENNVYTVEGESLNFDNCINSNFADDPESRPNTEYPSTASGGASIGGLSLSGNTFGFAINSDVEATISIVARIAAVSFDINLDSEVSFIYNGNYEYSGHTLDWNDENPNFYRWEHVYLNDLTLNKGLNPFVVNIETGHAFNLDCFYIIVNPTGDEEIGPGPDVDPGETPDYASILTIPNANEAKYTIEAESKDIDYTRCVSAVSGEPGITIEHPESNPDLPETSGEYSISQLGKKGNRFGFAVEGAELANLDLTIRVSSGNPNDQILDEIMAIRVNEQLVKTNYTITYEENVWHNWVDVTISGLRLKKGNNIFDFLIIDNQAPNIDCFYLDVAPATYKVYKEINKADNKVYTIEAEALEYAGCISSHTNAPGFGIERPETETSNGLSTSQLSTPGNEFGFRVVSNLAEPQDLSIVMRVSKGANEPCVVDDNLEISWNGEVHKTNYTIENKEKWHDWEHLYINDLKLMPGDNVFNIKVIGNHSPNYDCYYLIVNPTGEEDLGPGKNPELPDNPLTYNNMATIENNDGQVVTIEAEGKDGLNIDYSYCVNANGEPGVGIENPDPARNTSNGYSISQLGKEGNHFGFKVTSSIEATCDFVIMASPGAIETQVIDDLMEIRINDTLYKTEKTLEFDGTWHVWEEVRIPNVTLKNGENIFDFMVIANSAPNIDCFKIELKK